MDLTILVGRLSTDSDWVKGMSCIIKTNAIGIRYKCGSIFTFLQYTTMNRINEKNIPDLCKNDVSISASIIGISLFFFAQRKAKIKNVTANDCQKTKNIRLYSNVTSDVSARVLYFVSEENRILIAVKYSIVTTNVIPQYETPNFFRRRQNKEKPGSMYWSVSNENVFSMSLYVKK